MGTEAAAVPGLNSRPRILNPELREAGQDAREYRETFATSEEARAATPGATAESRPQTWQPWKASLHTNALNLTSRLFVNAAAKVPFLQKQIPAVSSGH